MPRKVFVAGEILTAADVNTNLADQAVMTFAGTAARGSAIGTAVEGMVTYLEDTDQLEVYGGTAVGWTSASNFLFGTATPTDGQVVSYSTAVSGYVPADAATAAGDNLLYNGAMQVAQRGTSATGWPGGTSLFSELKTADRWKSTLRDSGVYTQTVEADGPTGSGFTKSLKMEVTTAKSSLAVDSINLIEQRIEGQDLQGLKKGTSDAESLTLSFWVKSNVTGTYIALLLDVDNSRTIAASYSIASSGTWEKKTITFAGDTTGIFDNDNNLSLAVRFYLAAGTDFTSGSSLQTAWGSTVATDIAVGQTNLAASTGNYWQVTGVQLETGTVATGFDHKPYGVELRECQRYFWRFGGKAAFTRFGAGQAQSTTNGRIPVSFHPELRADPSVSFSGGGFILSNANGSTSVVTGSNAFPGGPQTSVLSLDVASGLSAGNATQLQSNNDTTAYIDFDAEL